MLDNSGFIKQLENLIHFPENQTYLLAVSGGVDSMVLAFIFQISGLRFHVAHVNYKLRGEDSDLDQKAVEAFCLQHNIQFHLYEVLEKDNKPDNSIQLWAREIRYRFFKNIQEREHLDFLVTAHHLNDQLETFIINLSKASGINGLTGIPPKNNKILRPLLYFSKEEIYAFAEQNNIDFREDLSNTKNDYIRNKIRNEIVPKLLETNDHFLENFKKSLSFLHQTKDFAQKQIEEIENRISVVNSNNRILDKEKLNIESNFVKFEILRKYGFDQGEEINKIFKAETGSSFFSKDYQLIINRNELILVDKKEKKIEKNHILLIENFDFSENQIIISLEDTIETKEINKNFVWDFDAEKLIFPLKLRRKREGDFFYPVGFSGKKKVSKFFKDEKLSIFAKQQTWILIDRNDTVLGVIPLRQDRRFIAGENTQKVLTIK